MKRLLVLPLLAALAVLFGGQTTATRVLLFDQLTMYVSPTGSDFNNCTQSAPCATAQHVYDTIATFIDIGGQTVTVQFANGVYVGGVTSSLAPTGGGLIKFQGDTTNVDNVSLECQTFDCFHFTFSSPTAFQFAYLVSGLGAGGTGNEYYFNGHINVTFTGVGFSGGGATSVTAKYGANVYFDTTPWYMNSTGVTSVIAAYANATVFIDATTVTTNFLSGSSFTQFVYASNGYIESSGVTFTDSGGAITGKHYVADQNGVINTHGGGANYFPGNSAGTTATGGQYL